MQFITSLFNGNSVLTAIFALAAVIIAILLVLWLLKFLFKASGNVGRGRNRRLSVVDSLPLDPKRQLLIIRRDNVEHLILTGGAQDLVIESGIAIDEAPVQSTRRPVPTVAQRKPAPASAPTAQPAPTAAAPATAIEQLRQLGQPTDKKAHLSLRHTGLLRPVNETEIAVSPENSVSSVVHGYDSAREDRAQRDIEGTGFAEDSNEANRR